MMQWSCIKPAHGMVLTFHKLPGNTRQPAIYAKVLGFFCPHQASDADLKHFGLSRETSKLFPKELKDSDILQGQLGRFLCDASKEVSHPEVGNEWAGGMLGGMKNLLPGEGLLGPPWCPCVAQAQGLDLLFSPFLFCRGSSPSTCATTFALGTLYLLFCL